MKKRFLLFSMGILLMNACASAQMPLPVTETVASTAAESHTLTPFPTITRRPTITPTIRLTPTSTLSPVQYPKLKDLALTVDDLLNNPEEIFAEVFVGPSFKPPAERRSPLIKDLTQEFIAKHQCELECNKQSWAINGLAIYITMIRTSDAESALLLSKNYYDGLGTNVWYRLPDITNLYKGVPAPPHTWVVTIDEHYQSLGATYGSIFF